VQTSSLDLNLLVVLDAVLDEGGVSAAARRLHLSIPATSRALGRLRRALDDPLLVRSGRGLVPTAKALELRSRVHTIVSNARSLLEPSDGVLAGLDRSFTVLADDPALILLGVPLVIRLRAEAPDVTVRFLPAAPDGEHGAALRAGLADLEIRLNARRAPDLHGDGLLRDRLVGIVRTAHPLAADAVTAEGLAAAEHLEISGQGHLTGPLDRLLEERGLRRRVVASVPTASAGLLAVLDSDAVAVVPALVAERFGPSLAIRAFEIPLPVKPIRLNQLWHSRHNADGPHRWLRGCLHDVAEEIAHGIARRPPASGAADTAGASARG
jgi:DNA-binding transcriptional LysR family regulator